MTTPTGWDTVEGLEQTFVCGRCRQEKPESQRSFAGVICKACFRHDLEVTSTCDCMPCRQRRARVGEAADD